MVKQYPLEVKTRLDNTSFVSPGIHVILYVLLLLFFDAGKTEYIVEITF